MDHATDSTLQALLLKISGNRPDHVRAVLEKAPEASLSSLVVALVAQQLPEAQRRLLLDNPHLQVEDTQRLGERMQRVLPRSSSDPVHRTLIDALASLQDLDTKAGRDQRTRVLTQLAGQIDRGDVETFQAVVVDEVRQHLMDHSLSARSFRQRLDEIQGLFGAWDPQSPIASTRVTKARRWRSLVSNPHRLQAVDDLVDALIQPFCTFNALLRETVPDRQVALLKRMKTDLAQHRTLFDHDADRHFCDLVGYVGTMALSKGDRWDHDSTPDPRTAGKLLGRVLNDVSPDVAATSTIQAVQRFEQFLQDLSDQPEVNSSLHDRFLMGQGPDVRSGEVKGKLLEGLGQSLHNPDLLSAITQGVLKTAIDRSRPSVESPAMRPLSIVQMMAKLDDPSEGKGPARSSRPSSRR